MVLTDQAKPGAVKLLSFLSSDEVLSLCQTVTNKLISVDSLEEAVSAIVAYSQNAEELLKRRKLKRDALFKYLASEQKVVDPNAEKHVLITEILKHWGDNPSTQLSWNGNSENARLQLPQVVVPELPAPQPNIQHSQVARQNNQERTNKEDDLFQFAKTFAEWFYSMLNNCNPAFRKESSANFTSVHFYPNCTMKMVTQTNGINQDEYQGGDLVHSRLLAFPQEEQLLFNPNLETKGIMCRRNPHGLTVVHVCGTVHRGSNVLGMFEQRFGLVRDPTMENNWRIKYTNLCLQAGDVLSIPKLGDGLAKMLPDSNT